MVWACFVTVTSSTRTGMTANTVLLGGNPDIPLAAWIENSDSKYEKIYQGEG